MPAPDDLTETCRKKIVQPGHSFTKKSKEVGIVKPDMKLKEDVVKWHKSMANISYAFMSSILLLTGFQVWGFYLDPAIIVTLIVATASSPLIHYIRKAIPMILPF